MALRLDKEVREVQSSIKLGENRDRIKIDHKSAAKVDDIRRALVSNKYDMIHFAGHACSDGLEVESDSGLKVLEWKTFEKMLNGQTSLQCILLNACDSMTGLNEAFAPLVIGMVDEIADGEAISFAKGFYDALSAGLPFSEAYEVATTAMEAEGGRSHIVVKLTREV